MATGSKRPSTEMEGGPSAKRPALLIPTLDIGPVASEEDLDIKVLKVQNRKLSERLRERNRSRDNLQRRVDTLEAERDKHARSMVSLRRMLSSLRDQLIVLLTPYGSEDILVAEVTNEVIADVGLSSNSLEAVFECVSGGVMRLGDVAVGKAMQDAAGGSEDKAALFQERQVKSISLIKEIQRREKERGCYDDDIQALEGKVEELGTSLAETRFDLVKSESRCEQLENQLQQTIDELTLRPSVMVSAKVEEKSPDEGGVASPDNNLDKKNNEDTEQLQSEVTELQALCESRLSEIEELSKQITSLKTEREVLEAERSKPPSREAIVESAHYKSLQSQYSIAAGEINQLKACVEDAKQLLVSAKQQHFMSLDEIRNEELKYQAAVREEMGKLETALASTKRDYELLKVDFERVMASNEQAAPRANELQITVDSLQNAVQQNKAELSRYKSRAYKAEQQLAKVQEERANAPTSTEGQSTSITETPDKTTDDQGLVAELKKLKEDKSVLEIELSSLKAASGSDAREKADIISSERKHRSQVDDLRKKFDEYRKDYEKRKEHIREEAGRRVKSLTEDNKHLQKDLSAKKHEAQALVSEMECTAQAFEEMQEQNIRLLQQLKEKDDANFKLMSEKIKSNSVQKLLLEEKFLSQSQLSATANEKQRLNDMIVSLQDRERNSEATIQSLEKELTLKTQAAEMHKRKALDSVQVSQENQLTLHEVQKMTEGVMTSLQTKTGECESMTQTNRRLQEEIGSIKRRLDKYKSREWTSSSDEVLLEEIRTYKVKLNCPCCSTRKKDTVLTKCFHVFCSECIRSRYDSRLRKCPKCGAAFGANDFHKIYLS